MKSSSTNEICLPRQEFDETFDTVKQLLAANSDPLELVVNDTFISNRSSVKVDLRQHLENLYNRMSDIKASINSSTTMVTIDFS